MPAALRRARDHLEAARLRVGHRQGQHLPALHPVRPLRLRHAVRPGKAGQCRPCLRTHRQHAVNAVERARRQRLRPDGDEQEALEPAREGGCARVPSGGKHVVRLVHDDEMGPPRSLAQGEQLGQQPGEVAGPILQLHAEHVDSYRGGGLAQDLQHLLRARRGGCAADGDRVAQALVVALGVHDHELEVARGEAFQQPRGQRALAPARGAGQQQALPHRHEIEPRPVLAVQRRGKRDCLARVGFVHVGKIVVEPSADEFGDALAALALRDQGSGILEPRQGVGDGDRHAAQVQEREIVLGVTHRDHVAGRNLQLLQGRAQPAFLVDAGRQHHHGALVENDLQL